MIDPGQLPFPDLGSAVAPTVAARLSPAQLSVRLGERFPPTPEQARAISAGLAPHVVVAGAGSGKTQTMGLRVVWLVANGLVEPHRVLGLTFTRKAAAELGERVRRMLRRLLQAHQSDPFLTEEVALALRAGEPTVSTYHSYAAALVGEHALRIGLEPSARLIGEAISWQYAAEVVESYDGPMDTVDRAVSTVTGDVLSLAGELAEHLREPDDVRSLAAAVREHLESLPRAQGQRGGNRQPKPVEELLASLEARLALLPLVERYAELKRSRGAMDYGDQVAVAARIARGHPEVGEIERARFGAVLLDEYQDTGEAQRVLLTALYGGCHPVTAVGDPRQSIYGWRGASAGNLERFLADFGGAPSTGASGLSVSFRNGERILAAANRVAGPIPIRGLDDRPLTPGPGREAAGRVTCALYPSVLDEAAAIADQVAALGRHPDSPVAWGEIAVLARKRSHFPRIEAELRDRGVPCEVVGLGGLLLEPEVVDVVSTLRVLGDPTAGNALVRLLAGPRWRIGPRDLDALGRRARRLAVSRQPTAGAGDDELDPDYDVVDERSLVDALDDPGNPAAYSAEGHRRLLQLRDELRALRRWTTQPLPDLVMAVVRSLCLDVELAARPGVRPADALINLDRFVEVAEDFVAAGDDPGLLAFLAYLDAAEERERGLEPDIADVDGDRVQLLTVHAAKGLEWDAVFVAGLACKVFPVEGQAVADWSKQIAAVPFPLRGDRGELPVLGWERATDQAEARRAVEEFREACRARGAMEERRLAYVAVTRARHLLACSGYWWDTATKPRGPSELLEEIREVCEAAGQPVGPWAGPPEADAVNPVTAEPLERPWPHDPLGPRRAAVEAAAALVASSPQPPDATHLDPSSAARLDAWREETDLLLAELERLRRRVAPVVELPRHLSVSQLVQLRRDPAELARQIRRPLPRQPAPQARRGTRFHLWLEQRWGQQRLIDVDELPGAADETAEPDADLLALQEAFRKSPWWARVPAEVEFPFDMVVDGVLLRGRCDAVFADDPDGYVDVVDWKTGRPKTGADAAAAAVQLAVYRLAWHHLSGTPLERIRAAFHYVGADRTVRPADLLGHDELVALVRSVPAAAG
ncbi:MAG TPA: ATP-dependent DNA helicase [Actinomycetes bacterium]